MNEAQLDTFLSVVRCGSYSKAAEGLFLSQPTVSYRIQTLEEELGVKLFNHRNFQAKLTPAGEAFVAEAEALCQQMQGARQRMRQFAPARVLTLGFPEMMLQAPYKAFMLVMQLLPDNHAQLASRKVGRPPEDVQQLSSGEVDLIFTDLTQPALADDAFVKRALFDDKSHVCMRADHPLAQEKYLTLDLLQGETVYQYDDTTHFLVHIRDRINQHGLELQGDAQLSFVQQLVNIKQRGGVMITNQPPINDESLVHVPLKLDPPIDIGVAWRREDESPVLRELVQALAKLPGSTWE